MKLSTARLTVHTRYPFRIARAGGSVDGCDVHRVIVRFEHGGSSGYGEAAPSPYYGQTPASVETTVQRINRDASLLGSDPFAVGAIARRLVRAFDDQRSAVAAIDAAMHDWIGKRLGVPVWRLLGLDAAATPPTAMTIGIDDPDLIAQKVREARGFGLLKIKVGMGRDAETLTIVREQAPDARLLLDANCGWSPDDALDHIRSLVQFDPEIIEQPIPSGDRDALRRLHEQSPIPIYLDEDFVRPEDAAKLSGCAAGVNVKLAKCGGIREALRAITLARSAGLKIMLGCMAETSLGISAGVHLASLADLVDLDGHLLLRDDPFDALGLDGDRVLPSDGPGLGADAASLFEKAS